MYTDFLCASCGFYIIFNFFLPFGCFSRERGRSLVDARYCSSALLQSLRTRAHFHFRSSPHFRRPSLLLFFSNEHFLFHLISSHLKLPLSINQLPHATVPSHNICTFTHTPRRKVTVSVVKHVFFVSLLPCSFDPVARASFEISGNTLFPFWTPCPMLLPLLHSALITPPHVFRKFHTYKHIHTPSSHLFFPHTHPGFTISSKCQTKRKIRSRTAAACA
jgi:hypothetical protein